VPYGFWVQNGASIGAQAPEVSTDMSGDLLIKPIKLGFGVWHVKCLGIIEFNQY